MAADGGVNARGLLGRFFKADGLNSPNEIRSSDLWISNLQLNRRFAVAPMMDCARYYKNNLNINCLDDAT